MTTPMKSKNTDLESLRELLAEMDCRTLADDIPMEHLGTIADFLRVEGKLRHDARIRRLIGGCGLRKTQIRTFEGFNWAFNPKLPKNDILAFRESHWIEDARNLVMIGDTGVGKTHFGKSLCYDAIHRGESAYFISAYDLINRITKAAHPATKVCYYGSNIKVLCIDEIGYTQQSKEAGDIIFQIIAKRSETLPTIVTTNLPPKQWGSLFAGSAATAILDRLSHNGNFLKMEGPSYRGRTRKK